VNILGSVCTWWKFGVSVWFTRALKRLDSLWYRLVSL